MTTTAVPLAVVPTATLAELPVVPALVVAASYRIVCTAATAISSHTTSLALGVAGEKRPVVVGAAGWIAGPTSLSQ